MLIRDYVFIRIGKVLIRDAGTRKIQKHLRFRVQVHCRSFCSGFPFHEFRQALPDGPVVTSPVTAAVIFATEFGLVVGDFHHWSLCRRLEKRSERCDKVVLNPHISALIISSISYVLCLSPAVSVACSLPTTLPFRRFPVAKAAIMKLLNVWLSLRP